MTSPTSNLFFLGPHGSYSSMASKILFEDQGAPQPCPNFEDIFRGLEQEHGYGILPLENNTAGAVDPAIDLLIASNLTICAEYHLTVIHSLASSDRYLKNISVLYSMSQPYYQSYHFIQQHLQHAEWIQCPSSSNAMERSREHGLGSAAIGSATTAQNLGLEILANDIQDRQDNHTRFVVLSQGLPYCGALELSQRKRSSVVFTLEDRPGTLLDTLNIFKDQNLNMNHIESRPSKDPRWNHNFLITVESDQEREDELELALKKVQDNSPWSRHLGTYPLLEPNLKERFVHYKELPL
jgi:chorismate mutase/prephenate dehydratase